MTNLSRAHLGLETLEARTLLAVVTWDGGGDGATWHDPLNWSGDELPVEDDDVILGSASGPEILLTGQSAHVKSLLVQRPLRITSATLRVNADATLDADTALAGFASLIAGGVARVNDTLLLGGPSGWGCLTLDTDDALVTGTGEIVFAPGNVQANPSCLGLETFNRPDGRTLTIGADLTVRSEGPGRIQTTRLSSPGARIINLGSLRADGAGAILAANVPNSSDGETVFENHGTLLASAGGILQLSGRWSTAPPISVQQGHFESHGTTTGESMNRIVNQQGTVSILGKVDLGGFGSLRIDATTGDYTLLGGGAIERGTIFGSDGRRLIARGGTLNLVTCDAFVDVVDGATLTVTSGITVRQILRLGSVANGSAGHLRYTPNTTLLGGGGGFGFIIFEGGGGSIGPSSPGSGSSLILDNQITIQARGAAQGSINGASVVNVSGAFRATGAGSRLTVFAPTLVLSLGQIIVEQGGTLVMERMQGDVGGNVSLAGVGSLLHLSGSYALNQFVRVNDGATLKLAGNFVRAADIDLNGTLLVDYPTAQPSPIATWVADVTSGWAGGSWTGAGVRSSSAAANPSRAIGIAEASDVAPGGSFNGVVVDGSTIVMHVTLVGDANLDRLVNLADFNILAANFGQSPRIFGQGDFNYDGVVNLSDFNLFAQRFGSSFAEEDEVARADERAAA